MKVKLRPLVAEAEQAADGVWGVTVPVFGSYSLADKDFREAFENLHDNVILTPKDLTEQLSQELQRWGMTPLPLDAPVEATLGLTLAAVRQITWDIKRLADMPEDFDFRKELKDLLCTQ